MYQCSVCLLRALCIQIAHKSKTEGFQRRVETRGLVMQILILQVYPISLRHGFHFCLLNLGYWTDPVPRIYVSDLMTSPKIQSPLSHQ